MESNGSPIKKILVTGPESTGKSTLSALLAAHYDTVWVPEYARAYLETLTRPYQEDDLLQIAQGQMALENKMQQKTNKILICDTGLEVVKVWAEYKYQRCHSWILEEMKKHEYDLYLLTNIDLPWTPDPLREHPHLRQHFFNVYKRQLEDKGVPFIIIQGNYGQRLEKAIKAIDHLLQEK